MIDFFKKKSILCSFAFLLMIISFPAPVARSATTVVAAVFTADLPRYRNAHKSFLKAMAAKGYDQSIVDYVLQAPNPDPISWSNAIRKVNAIGANVIVTYGDSATLAAVQESRDIPIVFVDVYAPLESGIVKSMSTPAVNATGISSKVPLNTLVKTAMEFKNFRQMGVLFSSREIGSVVQLKEMKRMGVQSGFSVVEVDVKSLTNLDSTLITLASQIDCLYITEASLVAKNIDKVIKRALDSKVPVITQAPESGEKGALLSMEANSSELGQQAADYVIKVLGGKKPALMPIAAPRKVDVVVNMKTARQLDFHVPIQVLNMATKVIK